MGDWREKMGVFPSPPPHQRDWNNIKVSPAFSKAAGARGQAPVKKEREAFPRKGEQTEKGTIQWMVPLNVFADLWGRAVTAQSRLSKAACT